MAQFSIKEAVKFSFAAYGRHLVLLLTASALVGASVWFARVAPRSVSQKLGIEPHLIRQDTKVVGMSYDEAKADPSTITQERAEGIVSRIFARPLESGALLLVTIFAWILFLFLLLGCMKLGLSLVDKNTGSLQLLFQISARQMRCFFGASLLFGLVLFILLMTAGVLLGVPMFALTLKGTSIPLFLRFGVLLLGSIVAVIVLAWALRFFFYGYCIVDKPTIGVFNALGMSSEITCGSMWRIVAALLIFTGLVAGVEYLINMLVILSGVVGVMGEKQEVTRFACVVLITPFSIPYFSYIYRRCTQKSA
jgi:hypothetical protein